MDLWTGHSLQEALADEPFVLDDHPDVPNLALSRLSCRGVSIDTRTLSPGDLFVAIRGDHLDGHDFLQHAFANGAAAALVQREVSLEPHEVARHPLFLTNDTFEALKKLGCYARARTSAKIAGVTGSVGKTTLKTMLGLVLAQQGSTTFSLGSLNNHLGVPLSLARMPKKSDYAVFEMGMNHAGEIRTLVQQVRPHVAIITCIGEAHIGNLGSKEAICRAKSEIFEGVVPGGLAVLNQDDDYFEAMHDYAVAAGISRFLTFGQHPNADVRLIDYASDDPCDHIVVGIFGERYKISLKMRGIHNTMNALGTLAVVEALGANLSQAIKSIALLEPLEGRGRRHSLVLPEGEIIVCDESYNANPTSMRAAIALAASQPRRGRLVLILGHMVELGENSLALHRGLAEDVQRSGAALVVTVGDHMQALHDALHGSCEVAHFTSALSLSDVICSLLKGGDVVMIKGSNSTRMKVIVQALLNAASDHNQERL